MPRDHLPGSVSHAASTGQGLELVGPAESKKQRTTCAGSMLLQSSKASSCRWGCEQYEWV